jgi:cytochrome c peroxidase
MTRASAIRSAMRAAALIAAGLVPLLASEAVFADSDLSDFARPAAIPFPAETPYTPERADLGQRLFFDPQLSADGATSCASCHQPDKGFEDGHKTAAGLRGRTLERHTPTLWNVAIQSALFWDGRSHSLEDQALRPVSATVEMNLDLDLLVARLSSDRSYVTAFAAAFPETPAINPDTISRAIATYERTLISPLSPFDAFVAGDSDALSPEAQRGFELFTGRARCVTCHSGWAFTNGEFHDIGLTDDDLGRGALTLRKFDEHRFRTPGLRELLSRAPYMHDGSMPTLEAVVDHYADHRKPRLFALGLVDLSPEDRAAIVAFLHSLDSTSQ